ncbi:transcobalamin-1 [Castor canadensis]|uniref:Transcobalamin-1 n=1 Tax=Castor canadensis TaxID=51338 RepID=A0A8B7VP90_CASCN
MQPSHQLPLVGLLLFSLIPSQICKICVVNENNLFRLDPLFNTMNKSNYAIGTASAYVLLSLRIVGISIQPLNKTLSQKIRDNVNENETNLSSGALALSILALGACHTKDINFIYDHHLIDHLKNKFQKEIEYMEEQNGNPLTDYYQLSLDVLALCLFNGTYSPKKVADLFAPENKNFYFHDQFSVDTGAMAVLALICVKRSLIKEQTKADEDLKHIENNIQTLVEKILSEKKENGLIGNTFSTGAAMQALFVSPDYYNENEWNCDQTRDTILKKISQGAFNKATLAAQILPSLLGKTYLDVNKESPCIQPLGNFNISIQVPEPVTATNSPSCISVHYSVKINKTYSTNVSVSRGSVFLHVMEEAQRRNNTIFCFTVEHTSLGLYVNSVQGIKADNSDRTYWQILSGDKPLEEGVDSYVVHNGENLVIRWSKY